MDAHILQFSNGTFDLVGSTGILHHLDLVTALSQIARVLRPNGHAVFVEPLGHNPFINQFRKRTPAAIRSIDEHPLLRADLTLFEHYFARVNNEFFYLTALLAAAPGLGFLLPFLESVARALLAIPPIPPYAWQLLITLSRPRL